MNHAEATLLGHIPHACIYSQHGTVADILLIHTCMEVVDNRGKLTYSYVLCMYPLVSLSACSVVLRSVLGDTPWSSIVVMLNR